MSFERTSRAWAACLRSLASDLDEGRLHVVTGYENNGLPAPDGEMRSALVLVTTRPGEMAAAMLPAPMPDVLHDGEGWQHGQRTARGLA